MHMNFDPLNGFFGSTRAQASPVKGVARPLLAALLLGGTLLAQAAQAQNAPAPAPAPVAPGPLDAPALIPAACVPVDGMTFELAGSEALLMKKGEQAQAIIHVSMFLPAGIHALQFPANELCPGGAKSHFMVNNDLYTVHRIRLFNNAGQTRVAVINDRGTGGTVPAR
jgi:hypothetical protein